MNASESQLDLFDKAVGHVGAALRALDSMGNDFTGVNLARSQIDDALIRFHELRTSMVPLRAKAKNNLKGGVS